MFNIRQSLTKYDWYDKFKAVPKNLTEVEEMENLNNQKQKEGKLFMFKRKDFNNIEIENVARTLHISNSMLLKYINVLEAILTTPEKDYLMGSCEGGLRFSERGIVILEKFQERKQAGITRNKDVLIEVLLDLFRESVPLEVYQEEVNLRTVYSQRINELEIKARDLESNNQKLGEKNEALKYTLDREFKKNDDLKITTKLQNAVIVGFEKTINDIVNR